ncbi:hypothetical protein BGZ46_005386, partial [Entomortierella lignicola]
CLEDESASNKRYKSGASPMTFRTVIEDAESALCDNNTHISDKVLEITLSGLTQSLLRASLTSQALLTWR